MSGGAGHVLGDGTESAGDEETKQDGATANRAAAAAGQQEGGDDGREQLSMVVIGHVDAGKSTLMGQLLWKLGQVDQRVIHKYRKQAQDIGKSSFFLAWIMDEDEDERAHGVTMDIGLKHFETENKRVTLLDAPGHQDFIPKMIAGAGQADVALLVVAASTGEFEAGMVGQTKEHATLCRSLGITQLLIAVNKLDITDPAWSQDRFDAIEAELAEFLRQAGYSAQRVRFVPVSGMGGDNVVRQVADDHPLKQWYTGPSLLEAIDSYGRAVGPKLRHKPMRLTISDVYRDGSGLGSVAVTGKLQQGTLQQGDRVVSMPGGALATVKVVRRSGRNLASQGAAVAGDNIELGLNGIDETAVSAGGVLCCRRPAVQLVRRFNAQILTMSSLRVPIVKGRTLQLHLHSVEVPCNVTRLVSLLDRNGDVKKSKPRCIASNSSAMVTIAITSLDTAAAAGGDDSSPASVERVCLEPYADCRALGRVLLRDRGQTVAAGIVTEIIS